MASAVGCRPFTARATHTGGVLGQGWGQQASSGRLVMSPSHCRDLKPTNVLLDEDDQPILMDLGSMNRARMEVTNSREAMAVQVGACAGEGVGGNHPTATSPASPLPLCRTGLPSAAPSPTVPLNSSRCPASASSMSEQIFG